MILEREAALLRIYCAIGDQAKDAPLHEAIVRAARAAGLAGTTAIAAKMGFSQDGSLYSDLLDETLGERRPVVIEIVDSPVHLEAFLPRLYQLVGSRGLITLERAEIELYGAK